MRKLSIAATLLIALTGCGAPALTAVGRDGAVTTSPVAAAKALQRTSANSAEHAKKAFDRIDADKNGAISLEEFQAGKGHGRPAAPNLDTDKDGKISFDEFKAHKPAKGEAPSDEKLKARFDALDTNKDGFISADEHKPQGRPGFGGGFHGGRGHGPGFNADADNDGKTTLDELKAAKGPNGQTIPADKAQQLFDRLDTNKDGAITKEDRPEHGKKPAPAAQ